MGTGAAELPVRDVVEAAIELMQQRGAEVAELEELGVTGLLQGASLISKDFRFDLDAYLDRTPGAPVRSLNEMLELWLVHRAVERRLRASLRAESRDTDAYRERLVRRDEVRAAIVEVMDEHSLDALVYPTIRRTAMRIGESQPGNACALSAVSGLPAITVPAGFAEDDMPVGVELLGWAGRSKSPASSPWATPTSRRRITGTPPRFHAEPADATGADRSGHDGRDGRAGFRSSDLRSRPHDPSAGLLGERGRCP